MNQETKERLQEFVKRADYLQSLSYLEGGERIVGVEVKRVGDVWQTEFYQPEDEKRDAVLFNLRLFLQDKDDLSLRRLTELYADPALSDEWKSTLEGNRQALNTRLDSLAAENQTGKITYRDVLNMFLFGKLGHYDHDDKAYKMFREWVNNEMAWKIMHNTFHTTIIWVLASVINIAAASKKELERV